MRGSDRRWEGVKRRFGREQGSKKGSNGGSEQKFGREKGSDRG